MGKFDIKIDGIDSLMSALKDRPKEIQEEVALEFEAASYEVMGAAKQRAPFDFGVIGNSITVSQVEPLHFEVVCPVKYAPYIEFGTRNKVSIPPELQDVAIEYKGVTGGTFKDLLLAITAWVKRKGIEDSAAYPIARSIATNGIKPHPFFFAPFFEVKPRLIERIKNILLGK